MFMTNGIRACDYSDIASPVIADFLINPCSSSPFQNPNFNLVYQYTPPPQPSYQYTPPLESPIFYHPIQPSPHPPYQLHSTPNTPDIFTSPVLTSHTTKCFLHQLDSSSQYQNPMEVDANEQWENRCNQMIQILEKTEKHLADMSKPVKEEINEDSTKSMMMPLNLVKQSPNTRTPISIVDDVYNLSKNRERMSIHIDGLNQSLLTPIAPKMFDEKSKRVQLVESPVSSFICVKKTLKSNSPLLVKYDMSKVSKLHENEYGKVLIESRNPKIDHNKFVSKCVPLNARLKCSFKNDCDKYLCLDSRHDLMDKIPNKDLVVWMPVKNIVSYTELLARLCQTKRGMLALVLLTRMNGMEFNQAIMCMLKNDYMAIHRKYEEVPDIVAWKFSVLSSEVQYEISDIVLPRTEKPVVINGVGKIQALDQNALREKSLYWLPPTPLILDMRPEKVHPVKSLVQTTHAIDTAIFSVESNETTVSMDYLLVDLVMPCSTEESFPGQKKQNRDFVFVRVTSHPAVARAHKAGLSSKFPLGVKIIAVNWTEEDRGAIPKELTKVRKEACESLLTNLFQPSEQADKVIISNQMQSLVNLNDFGERIEIGSIMKKENRRVGQELNEEGSLIELLVKVATSKDKIKKRAREGSKNKQFNEVLVHYELFRYTLFLNAFGSSYNTTQHEVAHADHREYLIVLPFVTLKKSVLWIIIFTVFREEKQIEMMHHYQTLALICPNELETRLQLLQLITAEGITMFWNENLTEAVEQNLISPKSCNGNIARLVYQQHIIGSDGFKLDEFNVYEGQVLPKMLVTKNMIRAWYWSDVTLVYDPGSLL